MVTFNPKFFVTLGNNRDSSIYVKDNNGNWVEFITYEFFEVLKRQGQKNEFNVKIYDIRSAEQAYVKEFGEMLFFSGNKAVLKGRIQKVTYQSGFKADVMGFGIETKLSDNELVQDQNTSAEWQKPKRGQWNGVSAATIAKEILSKNTDGSSPYIIPPSSKGIFNNDYGPISIRFEYANRLKALSSLAKSMNYEWWISLDSNYNELFNIADYQPDTSSATNVQQTFDVSGSNANAKRTEKETEVENMANKIEGLGRGDGINQIETSAYNASENFTTLRDDVTSSDTTIPVVDASSLPSSGTIRIMEEQITYTGKSGNDLTGATRGANSTTAREHKKGVFLEEHFSISNAQSNSSIGQNGLLDYTLVDRDIIDVPTLELRVSRELLRRKDPIVRIKFSPHDPIEVSNQREVGELVTINDSESSTSGNFRIVSIKYTSDYGVLDMEIECSNKKLTFIEQMSRQREEQENMEKYMQGATNIDTTSLVDNLANESSPSSNPAPGALDLYFFIPEDAVSINQVKLSYRLQAPKTWSGVTKAGSAHNHSINGVTSDSSDTGEYINETRNNYNSGFTTSSNPFVFVDIPSSATGSFDGAIVSVSIQNRTGSSQTYDWNVTNTTTNTTLKTESGITVSDNSNIIYNYSFDTNDVSAGDSVEFDITSGTVGTTSSKDVEGYFFISAQAKSTHSHTISGEATDNESSHTHDVDYKLETQSYTANDIRIFTSDDASAVPNWTEQTSTLENSNNLNRALTSLENTSESNVDMAQFFSATTGWKGIRIVANGDARAYASVTNKVFIESKTT